MNVKFEDLRSIEVDGPIKVLDATHTENGSPCRNRISVSISVLVVAVVIILLFALVITIFAKRIRKQRRKMSFMITATISHHADKEYSKADEKPKTITGENAEIQKNEIEFESVHDNAYYE